MKQNNFCRSLLKLFLKQHPSLYDAFYRWTNSLIFIGRQSVPFNVYYVSKRERKKFWLDTNWIFLIILRKYLKNFQLNLFLTKRGRRKKILKHRKCVKDASVLYDVCLHLSLFSLCNRKRGSQKNSLSYLWQQEKEGNSFQLNYISYVWAYIQDLNLNSSIERRRGVRWK